MTPQHAQMALGVFLLLSVGVAVNALYLQGKPSVAGPAAAERSTAAFDRTARTPPDRSSQAAKAPAAAPRKTGAAIPEERSVRTAHLRPDSARIDALPEAPQSEAEPETVRAIQRELKQRGYSAAAADGVMRMSTRAAIMAFEHDNGLPLTGEASEGLLKRILLGASAGAADPADAGKVRSLEAERIIRFVQQTLASLGYQPGRADGRPGEETDRAIREFEMDKGLVPKGRISADLIAKLTEAAAQARHSAAR